MQNHTARSEIVTFTHSYIVTQARVHPPFRPCVHRRRKNAAQDTLCRLAPDDAAQNSQIILRAC